MIACPSVGPSVKRELKERKKTIFGQSKDRKGHNTSKNDNERVKRYKKEKNIGAGKGGGTFTHLYSIVLHSQADSFDPLSQCKRVRQQSL